jgi:hypothetical protein
MLRAGYESSQSCTVQLLPPQETVAALLLIITKLSVMEFTAAELPEQLTLLDEYTDPTPFADCKVIESATPPPIQLDNILYWKLLQPDKPPCE